MDARRGVPRIVLAIHAAVDHLSIHASAGVRLADLVDDQNVDLFYRNAAHPRFAKGE